MSEHVNHQHAGVQGQSGGIFPRGTGPEIDFEKAVEKIKIVMLLTELLGVDPVETYTNGHPLDCWILAEAFCAATEKNLTPEFSEHRIALDLFELVSWYKHILKKETQGASSSSTGSNEEAEQMLEISYAYFFLDPRHTEGKSVKHALKVAGQGHHFTTEETIQPESGESKETSVAGSTKSGTSNDPSSAAPSLE